MTRIFALFCLIIAASASLAAEKVNENPLTYEANFLRTKVDAGSKADFLIELKIAPGHHAYGDMIKLKVIEPPEATLDSLEMGPLTPFKDKFSGKTRDGLHDKGFVKAKIFIPKNLSSGKQVFKIDFGYQACSDTYCLFPKTVHLEIPVDVVGASSQNEVGATLTRGPKDAYSEDAFGQALKIGGLQVFLFVFFSGFLTSLTPCVYPMIPITISIIGARSAQSQKSRAFLLSLSYVLGIAFTYSILGLFAALSGALFGSALSNPWVVGFVGLVFVAMALSMFGLFELQVPALIRDKFGNRSTGSGFGGAFLAGLFSGIVASPCIGPVLVSILTYVAQTRNAFFGFSLLFTFALGMGLLFLAIGTFSGLTSKIPKSGPWMSAVKILFGFVFLGMAFYYIRPLFLPKQTQLIERKEFLSSIRWEKYSEELLKTAQAQGKSVIIDFWADWCQACHELDELTYSDTKVGKLAESFVMIKVDATTMTPEIEALKQQYKVVGLPTVIFIDPKGVVVDKLTQTGFVKAEEFLKLMQNVAGNK